MDRLSTISITKGEFFTIATSRSSWRMPLSTPENMRTSSHFLYQLGTKSGTIVVYFSSSGWVIFRTRGVARQYGGKSVQDLHGLYNSKCSRLQTRGGAFDAVTFRRTLVQIVRAAFVPGNFSPPGVSGQARRLFYTHRFLLSWSLSAPRHVDSHIP